MEARDIARVDLHLEQQRSVGRHQPHQGLGFAQYRAGGPVRELQHYGVLGRGHHREVVAHLRLRQARRRAVAVAAVLGHVLGQFALPFLHEAVAFGRRPGNLLG